MYRMGQLFELVLTMIFIYIAGKSVPLEKLLFRNIISLIRGTKSEIFSYSEILNKILQEGGPYVTPRLVVCPIW